MQTGIQPTVQSAAFLRDARPEALAAFRAIYLLDVPRLDALARQNVEDYVAAGGGVCVFLGPNSDLNEYRLWSDEGAGFFPVPTEQFALLTPTDEGDPDLMVSDHPIFRVLLNEGQVFAGAIRFQQYVPPPRDCGARRVRGHASDRHPAATAIRWRSRNRSEMAACWSS